MLVEFTMALGAGAILLIVAVSIRASGLIGGTRWQRPRRPRRSRRMRRAMVVTAAVGTILAVAVVVEGAGVAAEVSRVRKGTTTLQQVRSTLGDNPSGWTPEHIATARILQAEAHNEIAAGYDAISRDPGLRMAEAVPGVGEQARAAKDGALLALAASTATGDYIEVAQRVVDSRTAGGSPGQRLLALAKGSQPFWQQADDGLSPALRAVDADRRGHLVGPVDELLGREAGSVRPLADTAHLAATATRFAAGALGDGQSQTYLVLLPNPSEIRPAGGFSGAIATTVMDAGTPTTIDVRAQEDFNPLLKKKFDIPVPLARYLKFYKGQLELGDAGWDPDFPTTAHLTEQMYTAATGRLPDGTISIDPYAISALLAVTGPMEVPGYGAFDSRNFFPKLNVIVNASSGPGTGKGALAPISRAALDKVLNSPAAVWPQLLTAMSAQARARHLQLYFHNPALARAAADAHYDGGLVQQPQDYLMVADGNVGATKGDYFVAKTMQVKAEVRASQGVALHQVSINYRMPLPVDAQDRLLNPGDGSYRDYVRFYIPREAQVAGIRVTGDDQSVSGGLDTITLEHGRQAVGAFIRVPRGTTANITLVYEVPLSGPSLDLYLQKQAGVPELLTDLQVSYPGGFSKRALALAVDSQVQFSW